MYQENTSGLQAPSSPKDHSEIIPIEKPSTRLRLLATKKARLSFVAWAVGWLFCRFYGTVLDWREVVYHPTSGTFTHDTSTFGFGSLDERRMFVASDDMKYSDYCPINVILQYS